MRRRRKTRYQWLENLGTTGPVGEDVDDTTSGRDFGTLQAQVTGGSQWRVLPLLADEPSDDATPPVTMVNSFQWDYIIKRIVGKVFIEYQVNTTDALVGQVLTTFGIFVARCDDEQAGVGFNTAPVGTGTIAANATAVRPTTALASNATLNYNPVNVDNIREPWIWRRQWILGDRIGGAQGIANSAAFTYPNCTTDYGSIQDGPHVDAKTARRVRDDERLFAIWTVRSYPVTSNPGAAATLRCWFDYRVLGAARKHRQKGAF